MNLQHNVSTIIRVQNTKKSLTHHCNSRGAMTVGAGLCEDNIFLVTVSRLSKDQLHSQGLETLLHDPSMLLFPHVEVETRVLE